MVKVVEEEVKVVEDVEMAVQDVAKVVEDVAKVVEGVAKVVEDVAKAVVVWERPLLREVDRGPPAKKVEIRLFLFSCSIRSFEL